MLETGIWNYDYSSSHTRKKSKFVLHLNQQFLSQFVRLQDLTYFSVKTHKPLSRGYKKNGRTSFNINSATFLIVICHS